MVSFTVLPAVSVALVRTDGREQVGQLRLRDVGSPAVGGGQLALDGGPGGSQGDGGRGRSSVVRDDQGEVRAAAVVAGVDESGDVEQPGVESLAAEQGEGIGGDDREPVADPVDAEADARQPVQRRPGERRPGQRRPARWCGVPRREAAAFDGKVSCLPDAAATRLRHSRVSRQGVSPAGSAQQDQLSRRQPSSLAIRPTPSARSSSPSAYDSRR